MTPLDHLVRIGRVLDSLGTAWVLGGSMASSIVGEPRSTLDIDIAVQLDASRIPDLVAALQDDYYISETMAIDAVAHGSSFNLVHLATGMKIDLFPLTDDPLDQRQLTRRVRVEVEPGITVWTGAADDQILRKLRWFREGGEVSDRQWRDVLAILRVQGERLDSQQLLADAAALQLEDLVHRALEEIGSPFPTDRGRHQQE